ncbi:MAG: hypothetical protein GX594_01610 [Pirellulaceae bacterium]|nr:hypothetical protein [Pirellulaceae bacterium]
MFTRCPKGHWYDPELTGGGCPKCAVETQDGPPISDDDVLAIMSSTQTGGGVIEDEDDSMQRKPSSGSAIMRRKKVCPDCGHEASFSFVYCPRCGAPLKLASVKLE